MNVWKYLPFILIIIAVVLIVHQYVFYGVWWEWEDLHHETWILMFAFAGMVLLIWRK